MHFIQRIALLIFTIFTLVACTPEGSIATPTAVAPVDTPTEQPTVAADPTAEVQTGSADVTEIDVSVEETEVIAQIRGQFSDGCTTIESIDTNVDGQTLSVSITTARPTDQICTQQLVPFEELVRFNRDELSAGSYTLQANQESNPFRVLRGE